MEKIRLRSEDCVIKGLRTVKPKLQWRTLENNTEKFACLINFKNFILTVIFYNQLSNY